ncbi:MAG: hypothetical protein PHW96_00415 [Candidatus Nanoarchaeia archaeon]|nr:hypothetical protein [Candidatus Nanoarchaeia archaeon]
MEKTKKKAETLIAKLDSLKERDFKSCNVLTECYYILSEHIKPLEKQFTNVREVCQDLYKSVSRNHHVPPKQKIDYWKRELHDFLVYIRDNQDLFEEMLRF